VVFLVMCSVGDVRSQLSISFGNMRARGIGPAVMSGRISTIDGLDSNPEVFYIGAANGGVWKTTSAGAQFTPVFDEHTQSIGHIEIDQAHPDTVWVGTGEPWVRNSVSVGTGIYVSKNGGRTWEHKGLIESERISKILIHPDEGQIVYVAAQGHLWDANDQRGVYRSMDFGASWQRVLFIDENTGCADITMHPEDPNILIAAMWDHRRSSHFFRSGGDGSGLYRSVDGGDTWTIVHSGLPQGILGRMAVEYAPSNSNIVYLTVEAEQKEDKGLYRSEDGGQSFTLVNSEFGTRVRPFYFSRLTVDPTDENKIYKCGLNLIVSENGGDGFRVVQSGVHSDIHAIWVCPNQPKFVIIGTDGGGYRSLDGGYNFEMFMNLPLSQFYHVSVDDDHPFNVYGGLQDNGSWFGPSRSPGGVENSDWWLSNWGDGFYSFRHPTDSNIIYSESQGGLIVRFDRRDGLRKDIQPLHETGAEKFRFNWNAPIHLSAHDPDRIYFGAQYLLRSDDRGDSWDRISPDLTTNNPDRQKQFKSGGLSIDNSTAENNTTIYTISESPIDQSIIWIGTDDGNLQVTADHGANWTSLISNIDGIPAMTWVSHVEASSHDPQVAFVTFDGHRDGDKATYIFKTSDLGQTWSSLVTNDVEGYVHCIRQDIETPSLLFAGTEFGLFISMDGGTSWKRFSNNLPKVAVRAITIQEEANALVVATHGRGIYIIDDITPLRQITPEIVESELTFFDLPESLVRLPQSGRPFGGAGNFVGPNPSPSASIAYYMNKRHTFGKMSLDVFDAEGTLVKSLSPGKSAGINIVELPLRLPPPKAAPTRNRRALAGSIITPALQEGTYQVQISKGRQIFNHQIVLVADRKSIYPVKERILQQQTLTSLYDMTERLGYIYYALDDMHSTSSALPIGRNELSAIAKYATDVQKYQQGLVSLEGDFYVNEGKEAVREEISQLYLSISSFPGKPTEPQLKRSASLKDRMEEVKKRFNDFVLEAQELNILLKQKAMSPILWRSFSDYVKP